MDVEKGTLGGSKDELRSVEVRARASDRLP
jgi:hypothetical protein